MASCKCVAGRRSGLRIAQSNANAAIGTSGGDRRSGSAPNRAPLLLAGCASMQASVCRCADDCVRGRVACSGRLGAQDSYASCVRVTNVSAAWNIPFFGLPTRQSAADPPPSDPRSSIMRFDSRCRTAPPGLRDACLFWVEQTSATIEDRQGWPRRSCPLIQPRRHSATQNSRRTVSQSPWRLCPCFHRGMETEKAMLSGAASSSVAHAATVKSASSGTRYANRRRVRHFQLRQCAVFGQGPFQSLPEAMLEAALPSPAVTSEGELQPLQFAIPRDASSSVAAADARCAYCGYDGCGHTDDAGSFYCEYCWAGWEQRRWPVIGGKSDLFKELTASMPLCTFGESVGQRIAVVTDDGDAVGATEELRRTGRMPDGRIVLGFDTEHKPNFVSGENNPICLIQLATPAFAGLFRLARRRPLPLPLRAARRRGRHSCWCQTMIEPHQPWPLF
jgi:hypothetical protein